MARPSGYMPVARYFITLLTLLALLYAGLFFGGKDRTPKLGLDLQGGTTITLRALTEKGKAPSADELKTARQIISNRVNGLGVTSAEVATEGDRNIVISIPGTGGEQAKQLGATALLEFRPVLTVAGAGAGATSTTNPSQGAAPSPSGQAGGAAPTPNGRPLPPIAAPGDSSSSSTSTSAPSSAAGDSAAPGSNPNKGAKQIINVPQGADTAEGAAAIAATLNCDATNTAQSPTANQYMASCDGATVYILGPVLIRGTSVTDASANFDTQGGQGWQVQLTLDGKASNTWAAYTAQNIGKQVAFVLDQRVLSAPVINSAIPGPTTTVSGSFNQASANNLANSLKFGALPLTFTQSEALTISPTLGLASLQAGLVAGLIGLGLVALYCLAYYRFLGLVTIASLAVSAALIYAVLVLLSRGIGLTLSLSGIAGFIVAVGITADSFVVYFERLKDEIREGRSVKSAVPRAWIRARRTILSADAVSFLAALILYIFTVGEVKGFAFTLGLSTVLDLVVVYLFTHPIVSWLSRFRSFTSSGFSGLGNAAHGHEVTKDRAPRAGRRSAAAKDARVAPPSKEVRSPMTDPDNLDANDLDAVEVDSDEVDSDKRESVSAVVGDSARQKKSGQSTSFDTSGAQTASPGAKERAAARRAGLAAKKVTDD
ncbi:MAG: protein translocase subunit SecD [Antricoccus sp.]